MDSAGIHLDGKRVVVMGLGRFGGGVGVVRWLVGRGARVLVTDQASEESLEESVQCLEPLIRHGAVSLRLGEHREQDFQECDLVVANPAVPRPWENRFLRAAGDAGVAVTTEIQIAIDQIARRGARCIGVTGSAGKSTTASMIAHALGGLAEKAIAGGNLGGSLLECEHEIISGQWVVLELSSAMLHWIERLEVQVGVVTSFSPNHLDWHGNLEHYAESKKRLLGMVASGGTVVLGPDVRGWEPTASTRRCEIDEEAGLRDLAMLGDHNHLNAAMAREAVSAVCDSSRDSIDQSLRSFEGLAHRLQVVGERDGVRFVCDSKATTPEASVLGVQAVGDTSRIHLIAGGYDKGVSLEPIVRMKESLAGLYGIGATGEEIAGAAAGSVHAGTLERAFAVITSRVREGDTVLLSPGCASWDQFDNYEQRGEAFIALAKGWIER